MAESDQSREDLEEGWRRKVIALYDLSESRQYFETYDALGNSPRFCEAYGALGMEMAGRIENSLLGQAFIAYARPFTDTRGTRWKVLPGEFRKSFTREEARIHRYVMEARKKLVAHSDLEGVQVNLEATTGASVIVSALAVPVVLISGEYDTASIGIAAQRNSSFAQVARQSIRQILDSPDLCDRDFRVFVKQDRLFDVDSKHCRMLIEMIDKVVDAIQTSLGLGSASHA